MDVDVVCCTTYCIDKPPVRVVLSVHILRLWAAPSVIYVMWENTVWVECVKTVNQENIKTHPGK